MRFCRSLALLPALVACSFGGPPAVDPATAAAIAEAEAKVRQNPQDMAALSDLAGRYSTAGRHFEAADRWKEVTDKNASDVRAWVGLADAYAKLGFVLEGYRALQRCIAVPSGNEECLLRLGMMAKADGSKDALLGARTYFQRFLAMAPNHPRSAEVQTLLTQIGAQLGPAGEGSALQPSSEAGAVPAAQGGAPAAIPGHEGMSGGEQVGELNPFGAAFAKALNAIRSNQPAAAEAALKEALSLNPGDVGAHTLLAQTYLQLNKVDLAIGTAEKAYKINPEHPQARFVLGLALVRTGRDVGRGIELWRLLLRDSPDLAAQLGVKQAIDLAEKQSGNK